MAPKRAAAKKAAEEPASKRAKAKEAAKAEPKKAEPKKEAAKKEAAKKEEPKKAEASKKEEAAKQAEAAKQEEPAEPVEEAGEKEKDDKKDSRAAFKGAVGFETPETTLNVVPTNGGRVLMALTDGGMQFLIAGARASVGAKAGRYLYEVRIVEALLPFEGGHQGRARPPLPRQLVRLGVSAAGSSLILGESEDGVCFDSEGFYCAEKKRTPVSTRFGRDQVIGFLLNLDAKSPNANTVSLFRNGERVSEPQPLPEHLKGKALFPHVAFRNVSLQVHFGPQAMAALPFKCRMLQEAASADVQEVKSTPPKDGKYEVLFPVAVPDEGTFDWLDGFLEKNPDYLELSDRKIQDWAAKSGLWKQKGGSWKNSNDKPDFNYGVQLMDDFSVHRAISSIAQVVPRRFVVMEVKQNLIQAERKANLKRFPTARFKKIAHVVVGEPPAEYRKRVQQRLLQEKQAKADAEWKLRKLEKERKKAIALKQKQLLEMQKAAMEARKKAEAEAEAEAAKKAEEAAAKAKAEAGEGKDGEAAAADETAKKEGDDEAEGKEGNEAKKEEKEEKEEEAKEAKEEAKDEAKEEQEEEEPDEPMPQVELTEEEKAVSFRAPMLPDVTSHLLNTTFAQFSIPEKDEGFDDVRFEWQPEAKSKQYLKDLILEKKITSRIEDLQPGEWFKEQVTEFSKAMQEWQAKQRDFTEAKRKEAAEKEAKAAAEGEEKKDEMEDEEVRTTDVDIFSVEDVCDVGSGEPLFSSFSFEDWTLLALRFELHCLQAAFKKDVEDPERIGIHESHLLFYYSRYFRKQLNPRLFGKETPQEVVELVKEVVKIDPEKKVLASQLAEEPKSLAAFVKQQEENRRKRQQRIDAGDETARLNFGLLQQQQEYGMRGGKAEGARTAPMGTTVLPPSGAGPRLVPAPRVPWQGGKAAGKGGGRWSQQTYAPRKGGKKG